MIIGMLVSGWVLLIILPSWEKSLAPVTFIPYNLLTDRAVLFGGMMLMFNFFNSGVWNSYFTSMLQTRLSFCGWNLSVNAHYYCECESESRRLVGILTKDTRAPISLVTDAANELLARTANLQPPTC